MAAAEAPAAAPTFAVGDAVLVSYGKFMYEARVLRTQYTSAGRLNAYVHYAGWKATHNVSALARGCVRTARR